MLVATRSARTNRAAVTVDRIKPEEHMADSLNPKVRALQLNIEGLLRLLGGTAEERLRFWEIIKGITTPAQFRVASRQLDKMQSMVTDVRDNAKTLKTTAGKVARG
jgi:hypothetical protein